MAPRRGSDGLLAGFGKIASAGTLLPALAIIAVLGLGGCGGGDSSDETNSSPTGAAAGADAKTQAQEEGERSSDGQQSSGTARPDGQEESGITPEQRKRATRVSMTLSSPVLEAGRTLPTAHSCHGQNSSPPLRWSGLPSDADELVLLVMNALPVDEKLFFDWAVAGLDPDLTGFEADQLPPGAVIGENSFGKREYSICPPNGSNERYVFLLYAIPKALDPKPGFDPLALREAVLDQSGNAGVLIVSYAR